MGRGRAKGKKLTMTNQDDTYSGEEEKLPAQKKRGRPQKSLKDEVDEEEARKIEDESSEDTSEAPNKESESKDVAHNEKKRIKNGETKEKADSVKEETGNTTIITIEEPNKSSGFRQNGSRRKSKPHRAAEAVVECN